MCVYIDLEVFPMPATPWFDAASRTYQGGFYPVKPAVVRPVVKKAGHERGTAVLKDYLWNCLCDRKPVRALSLQLN